MYKHIFDRAQYYPFVYVCIRSMVLALKKAFYTIYHIIHIPVYHKGVDFEKLQQSSIGVFLNLFEFAARLPSQGSRRSFLAGDQFSIGIVSKIPLGKCQMHFLDHNTSYTAHRTLI